MTATLRAECGTTIPLEVGRWRDEPDRFERHLLDALPDPVLDIGCGPGRIAGALAAAGRPALGIDPSSAAVAEASRRGAPVLCRSVFEALPGERRWGAAVLLDGNIGIGGDPVALLGRVRQLLRTGGQVAVEVGAPGSVTGPLRVRLDPGLGDEGPWFPWAVVSADEIARIVAEAGLRLTSIDTDRGRWMTWAEKP